MVRVFNQYVSLKSLLLILLEDILIVGGLFCGARLRFWGNLPEFYDFIRLPNFGVQVLIVVVAVQICFYYSDLYSFTHIRSRDGEVVDICQSIGIACLLLGVVYYIFPVLLLGRGVFFIGVGISAALVFGSRLLLDQAWRAAAPGGAPTTRPASIRRTSSIAAGAPIRCRAPTAGALRSAST